jgi:hypothetical protein
MSTSWYSLSFSAIPPNNYSVSYYFSVANGLVTGFYRYDNIGVNILAPQTLFGNNSGSDNVFTVGTLSFSISNGTNINDPTLYNNVVSGFPSATSYFNIFSTTGTTGRAGIYYWNNTGNNGGFIIARATVTAFANPNVATIVSPPVSTSSVSWVVGGKNNSGTAQIAYSTNGINYTNASNAAAIFGTQVSGLAHSGSIWVAGGIPSGGTTSSTGYSYDAITWYASSSGNSILTSINSIAYGNGKFVAIGGGPTYVAMSSTDGINWTGAMLNSTWNGWGMGVVYRNSTWVICGGAGFGSSNKMIAYSSDAITWSFANTTTLSSETRMVDFGASKWVAVGLNAQTPTVQVVYTNTSDMSGSWTNSIKPYSNRANFVKWGGDKFIVNGYPENTISLSSNGVNWSNVSSVNFVSLNGPINWNNNLWLMGQNSSGKNLLYSTDNGINWSIGSVPNGNVTYAIAFALPSTSTSTAAYPCFKQGSKILTLDPETDQESYVPVETLKRGDIIKTHSSGHKAISFIGKATLNNPASNPDPKNRLYRFKKSISSKMTEDLYITGEHCTLRRNVTEEQLFQIRDHMGDVYVTEKHIRCPACLDERATPYKDDSPVTIWHFALEHDNAYHNYGVYANGLLVESCSIEHMVKRSNLELL